MVSFFPILRVFVIAFREASDMCAVNDVLGLRAGSAGGTFFGALIGGPGLITFPIEEEDEIFDESKISGLIFVKAVGTLSVSFILSLSLTDSDLLEMSLGAGVGILA